MKNKILVASRAGFIGGNLLYLVNNEIPQFLIVHSYPIYSNAVHILFFTRKI